MEAITKFLIGNENYFPTIHIKIDKTSSFLYCIVLSILDEDKSLELCHCDNYHEKGDHIHYKKLDGTEIQKKFNFEGIAKTVEYFQSNWKNIMEERKNA